MRTPLPESGVCRQVAGTKGTKKYYSLIWKSFVGPDQNGGSNIIPETTKVPKWVWVRALAWKPYSPT